MSNEIQKDDITLPGPIAYMIIGGKLHGEVIQSKSQMGATTLTVKPFQKEVPITEDADFEVIQPRQLPDKTQDGI